ncbi:MAG: AAA family ATPase [Pseudodesulfovibrio sp.]|nr:AAA family ATPase [Pseudodesulfovibrio sp.]
MIKKIVLENFMAHELTELELGPGVTALTGPNNTGKSAIVEGLRCVATNPVPRHYIRHGAKEARVSVELDDGTRVVWVRRKRSSGYEIWHPGAEEPEEYWKFGRKPPEDVLNALKLDLVELETGGEIDVHVGNQREPVFLLNQPASAAAAFFAASTESAHLLAMQNLLKRRIQDSNRQERDLEERRSRIESEMDMLFLLPDIELQAEAARNLEAVARDLQTEIPVMEAVIARQGTLAISVKTKKASASILNMAIGPKKLNSVGVLDAILRSIDSVDSKRLRADKTYAILAQLLSLPEVFDTARLSSLCEQSAHAETTLRKAEIQGVALGKLAAPKPLVPTASLSGLIDQMLAVRYRRNRFARWECVLEDVAEPPVLVSESGLVRQLADMRGLIVRKGEAQAALSDLEVHLRMVEDQITECVGKLGCCPTCGADLDAEAFIDQGGRHDA